MKKTIRAVLLGSAGAQLIGLLSLPLLGFFYGSEDIATYGTFFAFSAILGTFVSFRLENLIFSIAKEQVYSLAQLSVSVVTLVGVFLLAFCWLVSPKEFSALVMASVFAGMAIGYFNFRFSLAVRNLETKRYVWSRFLRVLLELVSVLIAMAADFSIYVFMFFVACSYFVAGFFCSALPLLGVRFWAGALTGWHVLLEKKELVFFDFMASIFNTTAIYLPVMYFYFNDNAVYAAAFFLMARFIGTPALMISQGVGVALKQHASDEFDRTGRCVESNAYVLRNVIIRPLPVYILAVVLIFAIGYFVFIQMNLVEYVYVLAILLPLYLSRYIFNCVASLVYVLGMQKQNMYYQLLLLVLPGACLATLGKPLHALLGYGLASLIVYALYFSRIVKEMKS